MPAVTVGIPFYNAQRTLADAVRSIFAQTLSDWELLLVDDGSTDGSLDVALSIADSRVRVVSDGRNLGLSARLNQIAGLARGKFHARMDADDLAHPGRLEEQVGFLCRRPEVDVVGTGMYILDQTGLPIAKRLPPKEIDARTILTRGAFAHATIVGKVDWFRRNPYDSDFDGCEDRELWFRTFAGSHFANIPACYYFCMEHSSFSLRKYTARCRKVARCYRKHAPRLAGRGTAFVLASREELKPAIHTLAAAVGLKKRLLGQRSQPLSSEEKERAVEILARVRGTPLPAAPGTRDGITTDGHR
jgi:glycosyltransferase involved in cell wall biosynthesis